MAKKRPPRISARIASKARAKKVTAAYKRLPGSAGRYENVKTGQTLSRRQYEKLRHGGRSIETRAKELRAAGVPVREQKPRRGVLERLGGFIKELAADVRTAFSGLAKERKISTATIKRRVEPGVILKRRGRVDIQTPTGLYVFGFNSNGELVRVEVSLREASRVGKYKISAYAHQFPKGFQFTGLDGKSYTLPDSELDFERLRARVKEVTGRGDIVDDKSYKALRMAA